MAVFFAEDKPDANGPVRDRTTSSYIVTFEPPPRYGNWSRP